MSKTDSAVDVLITTPFGTSLIKLLQEVSPTLRITVHPAQSANEVPDELWARCEVLYTNRIFPSPELASNIKWVQLHWAGIDSLVDTPLFAEPNITVTTLSGANAPQIAEHVLTMLLAFGRKLPCSLNASEKNRMAQGPLGALQAA